MVVVVDGEEEVIETASFGAQDYLVLKQLSSELVWHAMKYAIERKRADDALFKMASIVELSDELDNRGCSGWHDYQLEQRECNDLRL